MLATSCQEGHLDVAQLLVHSYNADVRDCAIHNNEFAIITGLPMYAAAQAGKEMHAARAQTSVLVSVGDAELKLLTSCVYYCLLYSLLFLTTPFCVLFL